MQLAYGVWRPCQGQNGQALVEALTVLGVLGSLMIAASWLGRIQDLDLQLLHASRRAAFAHAHQGLDPALPAAGLDGYLQTPGHAWKTRQGATWLRPAEADGRPFVTTVRETAHVPSIQPGDPVAGAGPWRTELHLGDARVWLAEISIRAGVGGETGQLRDFDRMRLQLQRRTAILRGSGAAGSDAEAQSILAGSNQAWGQLAAATQGRGRAAQLRLQAIDDAWGRPAPDWDWLNAWAGRVPEPYLRSWSPP